MYSARATPFLNGAMKNGWGGVRNMGEQDLETKKGMRCDDANDTGKTTKDISTMTKNGGENHLRNYGDRTAPKLM